MHKHATHIDHPALGPGEDALPVVALVRGAEVGPRVGVSFDVLHREQGCVGVALDIAAERVDAVGFWGTSVCGRDASACVT